MEYDDSSDESGSELSDDFIATDDDEQLTWESEGDSQPAAPSPSSITMNSTGNIRTRLRNLPRRVFIDPNTQSDDESTTNSEISTMVQYDGVLIPHNDTESVTISVENNSSDSDETHYSTASSPNHSEDSVEFVTTPGSPASATDSENMVLSPESETDSSDMSVHSPDYSPPHSPESDSQPYSPHTPPESPPISPHSPLESPPPSSPEGSDVEVIEPAEVEEVPAVPEPARVPVEPPSPAPAHAPAPTPAPAPQVEPPQANDMNSSILSDGEENSLCSICMDPLTNSGNHRVVCLRCGHIFGQACLERWIRIGCNSGAKRCPTCNKKACLKDIRILYLPKVVPLDTVERDRLIEEKDKLTAEKRALEFELTKCKIQNEQNTKMHLERIQELQKQLYANMCELEVYTKGKHPVAVAEAVSQLRSGVTLKLRHTVEISKSGECRVMAFSPLCNELIVSQPSGNTMFAGFGVRVLNTIDFMPSRFLFLHSKMIRDLAFHVEDRHLLLSVSLDKQAKLIDLQSGTTVHTFKESGPLWSCCWDVSNPHLLLMGSQQGRVAQWDRRMPDTAVNDWESRTNHTPVVALTSMPSVANTPFPQGGFLSCRLNRVFGYARSGEMYSCHDLPLDGPFMSMLYDPSTQQLLTSSRPSSKCGYARISLNQMQMNKGALATPQIHTFNCGSTAKLLSRMALLPVANDSLVVAHHESGRTVNLWSSRTGNSVHCLPIREPVIDFATVAINESQCFLATLSDKRVGVYNVTS